MRAGGRGTNGILGVVASSSRAYSCKKEDNRGKEREEKGVRRTLSTRRLARADAEDLGGQAHRAGVTETLLLGALKNVYECVCVYVLS
jgi:hypothetical protein